MVVCLTVGVVAIYRRHRVATQHEADQESIAARAVVSTLPPDASLLETLRLHDRLPAEMVQARRMILEAVARRPGREDEFHALLNGTDWTARITAGLHIGLIAASPTPGYCALVKPSIEEIVRRLEEGKAEHDVLAPEAEAGLRMAWPVLAKGGLPKSLLMRLSDAIETYSGDARFARLVHNARRLARTARAEDDPVTPVTRRL